MDFFLRKGQECIILIDEGETEAVKIAASNLKRDLETVFMKQLTVHLDTVSKEGGFLKQRAEKQEQSQEKQNGSTERQNGNAVIIVGTIGVSSAVECLIDASKLCDENCTPGSDLKLHTDSKLRKEAYMICVRDGALVIAGTDRRGTIYGIYDFCEQIGVSPWYFWADVPVKQRDEVILPADYEKIDYPSVEYRGIFINDEEELEAWVQNYMGEDTIGVKTYEKVFELLLRLKANYIWPAMHVNSFNVKQENGALAQRLGIVVGTSHCDMLMRSNNREWKPWIAGKGYTDAKYDYSIPGRNREILQEYWRESVEQNMDFEVCYTLGMRGIHDSGFETRNLQGQSEEEKIKAKVELLTNIIGDQQKILQETLGRDTMMTFIPYKEVLKLYDTGMEIPEELTLVWANDNYGYIRRYPSEKEKKRKGGNGIYYHNSYWSPPSMSYVFLCSIPLAHTRNELQKAYNEEIRKLWVMNVGAIKPLEQEITFFTRLAWEIGKENALTEDVDTYVEDWINRTFTGGIGRETAALLNDFSQLTNVRKLENMDYDAFSQTAYGDEAVVRIHKYEELFEKGNALYDGLPENEKDAFFQMVLMRIHAAYFTNLQYYYGDRSTLMHNRGKMQAAAFYTQKAFAFDDVRRKLLVYYNTIMADGKWNGIVNPEGFPPPRAAMMPVCTPPLEISGEPRMLVDIWNDDEEICFVKQDEKWFEIGNTGQGEFTFEIQAPEWVALSKAKGTVSTEERIMVRAEDMSRNRDGVIVVRNVTDGSQVEIPVRIADRESLRLSEGNVDEDGILVVEAATAVCENGVSFCKNDCVTGMSGCAGAEQVVSSKATGFHRIKRLGRGTGSLVEACIDVAVVEGTMPSDYAMLARKSANDDTLYKGLTYPICVTESGEFTLEIHRFPSLNSTGRIRIGVSVDDGPIQIVESLSTDEWRGNWKKNVLNNVDRLYLQLPMLEAGKHRITFHPIDKYFAFSRFVIYTKERKPNNYIGIPGRQQLPAVWDTAGWTKQFYGEITLSPRPVEYAQVEKEEDTLVAADLIKCEKEYAVQIQPQWYLEAGSHIFVEEGDAIHIDAACALAQSPYAYTSGEPWQHCSSESYGRSGLAMYIRQPELKWQQDNAPALNYRIQCNGGAYTIWILAKFNVKEEAYLGVGVDEIPLEQEKLYNKGCLWRYEAEQIYRWVPVARTEMEAGIHDLQIYAYASGLRFDRIYLTKGSELPPMDGEWSK